MSSEYFYFLCLTMEILIHFIYSISYSIIFNTFMLLYFSIRKKYNHAVILYTLYIILLIFIKISF